jgi:hypothetical protein
MFNRCVVARGVLRVALATDACATDLMVAGTSGTRYRLHRRGVRRWDAARDAQIERASRVIGGTTVETARRQRPVSVRPTRAATLQDIMIATISTSTTFIV